MKASPGSHHISPPRGPPAQLAWVPLRAAMEAPRRALNMETFSEDLRVHPHPWILLSLRGYNVEETQMPPALSRTAPSACHRKPQYH
ncbi:hypothetical protein NDU88_008639 [Pleurodeles waltl]|uniref:Uncharacterized protein n=1 Tax=Pleurodeles waltl TaxID=8319 RepID=A0AAV7NAB2_PLEWA|nr:hypothetical protein NDU88_008639 [Pleurodeles waltl]